MNVSTRGQANKKGLEHHKASLLELPKPLAKGNAGGNVGQQQRKTDPTILPEIQKPLNTGAALSFTDVGLRMIIMS